MREKSVLSWVLSVCVMLIEDGWVVCLDRWVINLCRQEDWQCVVMYKCR